MRTPEEHERTAHLVDQVDSKTAAAVDARLREDPEWQAAADETREVAGLLAKALATEPLPSLAEDQRHAVLARAAAPPSRSVRRAIVLTGGSLAAALAIAVGAHVLLMDTEVPGVSERPEVRIAPSPAPPPASSPAPAVPPPGQAVASAVPSTVAVFGTVIDESGRSSDHRKSVV